MLTSELDHDDSENKTRSLYNISENRLSNYRVKIPPNKTCRGSSHGWLVLVDRDSFDILLLNPFLSAKNQIEIPHLFAPFEYPRNQAITEKCDIVKAVLSANPNSNLNYLLMAIYGKTERVALFNSADKTWTLVAGNSSFEDVIYYNDRFYLANPVGGVRACSLNHLGVPVVSSIAVQPPIHPPGPATIHLVESSGELLLVQWEDNCELFPLKPSNLGVSRQNRFSCIIYLEG